MASVLSNIAPTILKKIFNKKTLIKYRENSNWPDLIVSENQLKSRKLFKLERPILAQYVD